MQNGAIIEKGMVDWQIVQQVDGKANISLYGRWTDEEQLNFPKVYVRVVSEDTGENIISWQPADCCEKGKWDITIRNIPAGGLYRIETCLNFDNNKAYEWSIRGDMIHHIGVGDLYVITGQSNSAGYGKDPAYDPPEIGIHILKNNGKWDLASHPMNESTNTIHEENRERGNPGHSPYLSFARQLKRNLGYPIGLIQAALGGSPLSAWNPEEDGVLYRNMMKIINSQGGIIKGILWYQGCSDTVENFCDTYLDRFKSVVSNLRVDLKDNQLPILTVQLNRLVTSSSIAVNRCWGKIREAQRQAAKQISDVFIIPSTDSTLSDAIHISSASNIVLGERLARTALNKIYGRTFTCDAPDLAEAKKVENDKVKLTFCNVNNRIYTYDVPAENMPFHVYDESGIVKIKAYEQKDDDSITIILERELKGKCHVNGAFEQNPKGLIPVDFESHLPMLSFFNVEVIN